jgi:trehalose 6-phosphate phosphatase
MVPDASPLFVRLDGVALLLDVDGTLLDIAPTPQEVRMSTALQGSLARLLARTGGALALVSGRTLANLDGLFAPLRLPAIGGHGAEIRLSTDRNAPATEAAALSEDLRERLLALSGAGVMIEDKGYSVALHYRLAPEKGEILQAAVSAIIAEEPRPVEMLPGKAVIEVKPAGFTKGTALRHLMGYPPFAGRHPIFIGDDITDEAAFAVLREFGGSGFSVGRHIPGVYGHFRAPGDVRRWLEEISHAEEIALP